MILHGLSCKHQSKVRTLQDECSNRRKKPATALDLVQAIKTQQQDNPFL